MSLSDVLIVLTIVLAIATFISERSRRYILLKFNKWHWGILIIGFFLIHFLIAFNWFVERISFLQYFNCSNCPTPEVWAYLLSLSLIFWVFYKIFFGFYPATNLNAVIGNYNNLLLRGEYAFLAELIERYHFKDILQYLEREKLYGKVEPTGHMYQDERLYEDAKKRVIISSKLYYAASIYGRVLLNDAFVDAIVPINPRFYAPIIQRLNEMGVRQEELVNRYLKLLTKTKNGFFFREIRNNQNLGENQTYRIEEERPILFALFSDINVAAINEAWRGIADEAILEIKEESRMPNSPLRLPNIDREDDLLWSYRIQNAIHYIDIMVRQAINSGIDNHMWMYYYEHFIDHIIENMDLLSDPDSDQNRNSGNYSLIENIFGKMRDWKDVVLQSKHENLIKSIYDVVGRCMFSLATTDKLADDDKQYLMDGVWIDLMDTWGTTEEEKALVEKFLDEGYKIFAKPSGLFIAPYDRFNGKAYIKALKFMWERRDKPRLHDSLEVRAEIFEKKVMRLFKNYE